MSLTIDCGEGRHEACRGAGTEHYLIPQADDGAEFECECSCHWLDESERARVDALDRDTRRGLLNLMLSMRRLGARPDLCRAGGWGTLLDAVEHWQPLREVAARRVSELHPDEGLPDAGDFA